MSLCTAAPQQEPEALLLVVIGVQSSSCPRFLDLQNFLVASTGGTQHVGTAPVAQVGGWWRVMGSSRTVSGAVALGGAESGLTFSVVLSVGVRSSGSDVTAVGNHITLVRR